MPTTDAIATTTMIFVGANATTATSAATSTAGVITAAISIRAVSP